MKNRKRFKLVPRFMSVMIAALFVFSGIPMSGSPVYAAEGDRAVTYSEYMDITALPENEQIVDGGYYVFSANITTDINMTESDRKERLLTSVTDTYNQYMELGEKTAAADRILSEHNNSVALNKDNNYVYQITKVDGKMNYGNQGYYIRNVGADMYLDMKQDLQTPILSHYNYNFVTVAGNQYSTSYYKPYQFVLPTYPFVFLSETKRVWYWDQTNKEFYTLYTMPGYDDDYFGFKNKMNGFYLCSKCIVDQNGEASPTNSFILSTDTVGSDGKWALVILIMQERYIYIDASDKMGIYKPLYTWSSYAFDERVENWYGPESKFVLQGINAGKREDNLKRKGVEELRDPAYRLGLKKGISEEENNFSTAMLGGYHPGMENTFVSTNDGSNEIEAGAERQSLKVYKKIDHPTITFDYNDGTGGSRTESFYYDQDVTLTNYTPYDAADDTFLGWSTSKHGEVINEITMTSDQTLYAQWKELNVSVGSNDEQLGSVTVSEPEGFNGKLQKGDSLKVTASPRNENVIFKGWEIGDEIVSTEASYEIVCTADLSITAVFECTGHKWSIKTQKATADADGRVYKKCTVCGAEYTLATIPSAGEDDIVQGTAVLRDTANQPDAQTVYMANNAWRVIGYDGTGAASTADTMTFLSAGTIKDNVVFNPGNTIGDQYYSSTLQSEVDAVAGGFAEGEKEAIATRDLASGQYIEPGDGQPQTDGIAGPAVEDALLWPLSAKEAVATNEYLRLVDPDPTDETWPGYWWLRSNGEMGSFAAAVMENGTVYEGFPVSRTLGLRPAFHADLNTVLFTSAAEGGKNTGALGADALAQTGKNRSCEWKLTVKDNAHKDFAIDSARSCDGKVLYIKYSGAEAGDNEYISGVIVSFDGKVKRYGRLAVASDDEASVKVNIDGKLDDGDSLYIFSEQYNGDFKTDFASPLQKVSIPTPGHDWDTPEYTWANDNSSVTATRSCKNDATHVETETATATFKVTKEATEDEEGEKIYTANFINGVFATQTKTVTIPKLTRVDPTTQTGEGGSAIGKGASIEAAHKAITTSNSEEGPKGSKFSPMQLKSTGQGKTNVKLTWKKPAGAVRFVVYGNACGKKNKLMKLCETKAASYNSKKINGKALKKGTYYKYMVVAVDKNNKVVSASKVVHAATKGGKVKNYTSVTTKTKKNKVSLKKGKTFKLKANAKGKNVRKHRGICYETSNAKVATVSSKGVIKAKGKGNCTVYAYAQNGVMKAIKVTVK